jgi:hypothetical protein
MLRRRDGLSDEVLSLQAALEDNAEKKSYQSAAIAGCIVAKANLSCRYLLHSRELAGDDASIMDALALTHCR